eukprot:TRINITY_DN11255_c0_g1_i1.p2 TRINITY_DN11255_c0_g1~~TRINITY_DN11255_c0_g1_i1.p2  ORF type:complete len:127 (-),score=28.75 TRINITY_DN11255_c0_g1_i1:18-398(-)
MSILPTSTTSFAEEEPAPAPAATADVVKATPAETKREVKAEGPSLAERMNSFKAPKTESAEPVPEAKKAAVVAPEAAPAKTLSAPKKRSPLTRAATTAAIRSAEAPELREMAPSNGKNFMSGSLND